jgi:hypothetical protein
VTLDPEAHEANEADLLEQQAPLEERPALDTSKLGDPLAEADEADLLDSAQTIPASADDERR